MFRKIIIIIFIILSSTLAIGLIKKDVIVTKIKNNRSIYQKLKKVRQVALSKFKDEEPVESDIAHTIQLKVDVSQSIGPFENLYNGIGMGIFYDGVLKPHNREFFKLAAETNKKIPFIKYVNMKCIFVDDPEEWGRHYGAAVVHQDKAGEKFYHWKIVGKCPPHDIAVTIGICV